MFRHKISQEEWDFLGLGGEGGGGGMVVKLSTSWLAVLESL